MEIPRIQSSKISNAHSQASQIQVQKCFSPLLENVNEKYQDEFNNSLIEYGDNSNLEIQQINNSQSSEDLRLQSLKESIENVFVRIMGDEILETMKEDTVSKAFLGQRIEELFQLIVFGDREKLIHQLSSQYATLKEQYSIIESQRKKEQSQYYNNLEENERIICVLKDSLSKEQELREKNEKEFSQTMKRYKEEKELSLQRSHTADSTIQKLNINQNQLNERINYLEQQQEEQNKEMIEQKESFDIEMKLRLQDIMELQSKLDFAQQEIVENNQANLILIHNNEDLQKNKDLLNQEIMTLNQSNNQTKNLLSQYEQKIQLLLSEVQAGKSLIEKLKEKYIKKSENLKRKITDCEGVIRSLRADLNEESEKNIKSNSSIQKLLNEARISHSKQLEECLIQSQLKLEENSRRNEDYISEMQAQYQDTIRDKIDEIKSQSHHEIEEMRVQERQLKRMLEEKLIAFQNDYISKTLHEEILEEQTSSFEKQKNELERSILILTTNSRNELEAQEQRKQNEISNQINQFNENQREYQQKNMQLNNELMELEAHVREKDSLIHRLEEECESYANELRESIKEVQRQKEKYIKNKARFLEMKDSSQKQDACLIQTLAELEITKHKLSQTCLELERSQASSKKQAEHLLELQNENQKDVISLSQTQAELSNLRQTQVQKDQQMKEMYEQNQILKQDLKSLNSKLIDLYQEKTQKNEFDSRKFEEQCGAIANLQCEIQEKTFSIEKLKRENELLFESISKAENQNNSLQNQVSELTLRIEQQKIHFSQIKKAYAQQIKEKIKNIVSEFSEFQELVNLEIQTISAHLIKEVEYLNLKLKEIDQERQFIYQNNLKIISNEQDEYIHELQNRFQSEIEDYRMDKEREIKILNEYSNKLNLQNEALIEENKILSVQSNEFKIKIEALEDCLSNKSTELDQLVVAFDQQNQQSNQKMSELEQKKDEIILRIKSIHQREIEVTKEEVIQQKSKLTFETEQKYRELELMHSQNEKQQKIFEEAQKSYQEKIEELNKEINQILENNNKDKQALTEVEIRHRLKEEESRKLKNKLDKQLEAQQIQLSSNIEEIQSLHEIINNHINQKQQLQERFDQQELANKKQELSFQKYRKESDQIHGKSAKENEDLLNLVQKSLRSIERTPNCINKAIQFDQEIQKLTQKVDDLQNITRYYDISKSTKNTIEQSFKSELQKNQMVTQNPFNSQTGWC